MIGLLWSQWRHSDAVARQDVAQWSAPPALMRRLEPAEQAGTVVLWHPESPGVKVRIRPGLLRRLGWWRLIGAESHEFATLREMRRRLVSYVSGLPWIAGSELEHIVDPRLAARSPEPGLPPVARGDEGSFR